MDVESVQAMLCLLCKHVRIVAADACRMQHHTSSTEATAESFCMALMQPGVAAPDNENLRMPHCIYSLCQKPSSMPSSSYPPISNFILSAACRYWNRLDIHSMHVRSLYICTGKFN